MNGTKKKTNRNEWKYNIIYYILNEKLKQDKNEIHISAIGMGWTENKKKKRFINGVACAFIPMYTLTGLMQNKAYKLIKNCRFLNAPRRSFIIT